jgi:hypothetical protein
VIYRVKKAKADPDKNPVGIWEVGGSLSVLSVINSIQHGLPVKKHMCLGVLPLNMGTSRKERMGK